jgi:hypothetical protein
MLHLLCALAKMKIPKAPPYVNRFHQNGTSAPTKTIGFLPLIPTKFERSFFKADHKSITYSELVLWLLNSSNIGSTFACGMSIHAI